MRKLGKILALVLVLAFVLAPVAEASISMVWSRFLAVKADRVLVTTDDSVGAPSAQTAGTVVIESGGNTPALSISGYTGQTEPLVYLEDGAGTEVFAIGPAGELTTTGAMSLGGATFGGDVAITGTLDIQEYLYNSLGTLQLYGDVDVYGYLYSTNGPVGISDNVVVTGTMDIQGNVADSGGTFTIGDDASVTGDLSVTGATSLGSGITDTGIFTITAPGLVIDAGDGKMLTFIPGSDPNFGVGSNNIFGPAAEGSSILGGAGHTNNVLYGSIGGGITNTLTSGDYANITGGQQNTVTGGEWCFIGGGFNNTCSGDYGAITGGITNTVSADYGTAIGGQSNIASGLYSIAAGVAQTASGAASVAIGGYYKAGFPPGMPPTLDGNTASGVGSAVVGGGLNTASGDRASVLGGVSNTASGDGASILGGNANTASGDYTVVLGGLNNVASGGRAVALGYQTEASGISSLAIGSETTASGQMSFAAGYGTTASGNYSLASGSNTTASGAYSFAAGSEAVANKPGTFVWADSTGTGATAVITNSVTMLATNGYYLTGALHADVGVTQVTTDTLLATTGRGGWYYLESGGITTTLTLPAADPGLSYCFYNLDGSDYYIAVQTGDQIHTLTAQGNNLVTNTTAGDSICLLAINTTYWIAAQRTGTWTDVTGPQGDGGAQP